MIALCGPFSNRAQAASPEYKLKAVFLFNFVQFVDWPTNVFTNDNAPIIIGVLGNDPFGQTLDETVEGEVVKGRALQVRRYRTVEEVKNCQVLFISESEAPKLNSILAALKGRSILTVGDMADFANRGGMVRFIKDKNRIRFGINVDSAKAAHLMISAKLLQLADIVPSQSKP